MRQAPERPRLRGCVPFVRRARCDPGTTPAASAVRRTNNHIYAQVVDDSRGHILASASTIEKGNKLSYGGNVAAAVDVGKRVAERAKEKGVSKVYFDRHGKKYHGRVAALADAAREAGLDF